MENLLLFQNPANVKRSIQELILNDRGIGESQIVSGPRVSELISEFSDFILYEKRYSPETNKRYCYLLNRFIRDVGDIRVTEIKKEHFRFLLRKMGLRGVGENYISSVVMTMRSFLKFCKLELELPVMDWHLIGAPKKPKREVSYLDKSNLDKFLSVISR